MPYSAVASVAAALETNGDVKTKRQLSANCNSVSSSSDDNMVFEFGRYTSCDVHLQSQQSSLLFIQARILFIRQVAFYFEYASNVIFYFAS